MLKYILHADCCWDNICPGCSLLCTPTHPQAFSFPFRTPALPFPIIFLGLPALLYPPPPLSSLSILTCLSILLFSGGISWIHWSQIIDKTLYQYVRLEFKHISINHSNIWHFWKYNDWWLFKLLVNMWPSTWEDDGS